MNETISELKAIWELTLKELKGKIEQRIFDSFFAGTDATRVDNNVITVNVSTPVAAAVLKSKFSETIDEVLHNVTGTDFHAEFVASSSSSGQTQEAKDDSIPQYFTSSHLNKQFTFDNFIVGPSNREAYQASLMIASTPGQLYNPLLLYSGPGLGKTHLLQAIGNAVREKNPGARVLFLSTSDFINEYVKYATGYKGVKSFTDFFRKDVDLFLIDDIQLLKQKAKTMEMFFDAFQTLINANKQVVITSDQHPNNLDGIDERLKSRFSQGLVLSIDKPDLETSENILKSKIPMHGLDVKDFDEEVVSFLARKFCSNVRDLEGALTRLVFYTINIKPTKHITMSVVSEAIRSLIEAHENQDELTENKIIAAVANYYSLTPSQITGKIRTSRVAMARHIAMYLDREMLGTPLIKIGQAFGGKDHSTVLSGISKVERELKNDPDMGTAISEIKSKLSK